MAGSRKKTQADERLRIGAKIKERRQKKRLTLEDLAAKTGLEKSVLTKIEKEETVPPLGTLLKLSKALDISMAYFFEDEVELERISVTRGGERVRVKRRPHHQEGEVDYIYESLESRNPNKHMEPFLVEFLPLETGDMVFMSHEGEEFHYVLEGKVEFRTDDRVEVLCPGDSLYFESEINHSFRSLEGKPAKVVACVWSRP
ncbi:MAG TPA: XRE family transcriptional regulator [Syntrophales bacterium]|nr:XRE family transcriptional regulator [Syntrophales bacterium]HOX93731.1 XRE family transcriptional regulator [Syntrophales bacterium]HPI57077.1 XRE family transcriptional regulator [Syntrophales bacterium]HPN23793.1 XRE family transcriptional regulator [Syntrophales bacterium]HQM30136.1 XRE family transcriptional regulator [Syntrophales bacterium]